MSEDWDISHVAGNAPDDVKRLLGNPKFFFANRVPHVKKPIFGESITERLVVTEVSVMKKAEEPEKLEGRVVCELTVEEDMINGGGNMHGGCAAFLIDMSMFYYGAHGAEYDEYWRRVRERVSVAQHRVPFTGCTRRQVAADQYHDDFGRKSPFCEDRDMECYAP